MPARATEIADIAHVVHLSTDIGKSCEVCGESLLNRMEDIASQINHYLGHGFLLLHVGPQTSHSNEGLPWHSTVAVVGKT